jgi:hypothetical protein
MAKIFVSYRRKDSAAIAGWMDERLRDHFGSDAVFRDTKSIAGGEDFRRIVASELGQCDVVVAVIGPNWIGEDVRRIDDPRDLVRIEIESALARRIAIIPVLVNSAEMPAEAVLPPSLRALSDRNALKLDEGPDFDFHVQRIIERIGVCLERAKTTVAAPPFRAASTETRGQALRSKPRKLLNSLHNNCDHDEQERKIWRALKEAGDSGPMVVIVHGGEDQCDDRFLERLRHKLPQFLKLDQEQGAVEDFRIKFPSALPKSGKFHDQLVENLSEQVLEGYTGTLEEIAGKFAKLKKPIVIIQTRLITDVWVKGGSAIIESFLEFWGRWQILDGKFRLLVFLNVTYQRPPARRWLIWPRGSDRQRANKQLRAFLEQRSSSPGVVVLDELRGVSEYDLVHWAEHKDAQKHYGGRDLLRDVRALCRRLGFCDSEQRIPMQVIADELERMLKASGAGSEVG